MLPIMPFKGEFRRPDLRNHRKILVIDGRVAFTGSLNLIEPGYNKPKNHAAGRKWVELVARVEGPMVLGARRTLRDRLVLRDLRAAPRRPRRGAAAGRRRRAARSSRAGRASPTENNLRLFTTLIYSAQQRISIVSPYFVPDESLLYAVTTAAQRGVDVELFVSAEGDQFMVWHAQRSYYEALLRAGVRIWLYPAPFVLHSKFFTVDDDVAVIGSEQHGHALVRAQLRGVDDAAGRGVGGRDARRCRTPTARCAPSSPSTSGWPAARKASLRRQRHAADGGAAVTEPTTATAATCASPVVPASGAGHPRPPPRLLLRPDRQQPAPPGSSLSRPSGSWSASGCWAG